MVKKYSEKKKHHRQKCNKCPIKAHTERLIAQEIVVMTNAEKFQLSKIMLPEVGISVIPFGKSSVVTTSTISSTKLKLTHIDGVIQYNPVL